MNLRLGRQAASLHITHDSSAVISQVLGCLIQLLARFVSFSVPDLSHSPELNSSGHPSTCVSRYWTGSDSEQETLLDAIDTLELCASK